MNSKYESVAAHIRGPLATIAVPFTEGGEVDHESLANWIDYLGEKNVGVMWMTGGSSEMVAERKTRFSR